MTTLKIGSKILSVIWGLALLVLALGFVTKRIAFFPGDPILIIDYAMAGLFVVLAVLSFIGHWIVLLVSSLLFLLCAIFDGWGLLVKHDIRCWPGAAVAAFGIIYVSVKLFEYKKQKQGITKGSRPTW